MLCASLWKILWISAIATTSILFCGYQICNGKAAPSPTRYDFSRDIASKLWDSLVTVFPRDNEGVVTWVRFLWESMHQLLNAEEKIKLGSNGCRIEWERGKSVRNRSESLSWIWNFLGNLFRICIDNSCTYGIPPFRISIHVTESFWDRRAKICPGAALLLSCWDVW